MLEMETARTRARGGGGGGRGDGGSLVLASPLACLLRATIAISPKGRACSQASIPHVISGHLALSRKKRQ